MVRTKRLVRNKCIRKLNGIYQNLKMMGVGVEVGMGVEVGVGLGGTGVRRGERVVKVA